MTIEKGNFEDVTEADLQALVDAQVPESLRLEHKLEAYGRSDADKRELLKDVTAMANSHGGHIIIGIGENEGSADTLEGTDTESDDEILRIEQILRNAVDPPIPRVRIRQIELGNGRNAIVIRVPRSWNPPHRVSAQGTNKFFLRHTAGVHEPSIEELRAMFNQSQTAIESSRSFHNSRIEKIVAGEGNNPLVGDGKLIFHLVPTASFSGLINLDVEDIHNLHQAFSPMASHGMNMGFNFLGYRTERGGEECHGYTQIFRNGSLEATIAGIVREHNGHNLIPGLGIERYFFQKLDSYVNGLRDLGVPTPLIALITLEGVGGAIYRVSENMWGDEELPITEARLTLPECIIEDFGEVVDYHKSLKPAFDSLWNAINIAHSQFFNEEGLWVGDQQR